MVQVSAMKKLPAVLNQAANAFGTGKPFKKRKLEARKPAISDNQQIWHVFGDDDDKTLYDRPTEVAEVWENSTDLLAPFKHHRATHPEDECAMCKTQSDSLDFTGFYNDEAIDDRESPVPEHLVCFLKLTCHDARQTSALNRGEQQTKQRHIRLRPIRLRWLEMSTYCAIVDRLQRYVDSKPPIAKRAYLRSTRVSLHEWSGLQFNEIDSCSLRRAVEWDHVLRMICRYCSRDPLEDSLRQFCLQIECNFEWFPIESYERCKGRQFIESIRTILDETEIPNFEPNGCYRSRRLLRVLLDRDTITHLVRDHFTSRKHRKRKSDKTKPSRDQQSAFVKWLANDCHGILGIAIQSKLNLDCLYSLMTRDNSINDNAIPLGREQLRGALDERQIEEFCKIQRNFRPFSFDKPNRHDFVREHKVFPVDQAPPISFEKMISDNHHRKVFAVKIHPEFHNFSRVRVALPRRSLLSTNS